MNPVTQVAPQVAPQIAVGVPSESLLSLALLGKTALALGLVVACVLACGWLVRRVGVRGQASGQLLRVVSSTSVGQREKVVIVEVQGQWLVVGVTAQQVSLLAQMDGPPSAGQADAQVLGDSFAQRLGAALRQNLQGSGKGPGAGA